MFDPKLKEALSRVQKPGRYTGGEPGSVYKNKDEVDVRFAFCFPDTYEVGMSFLGEKILYELLNSHENWWCERAFMPWLDMKAEMERLGLPLYTMESKDPLTAFDAVGFTLQYELSYTNILAMLDLAGIPFYSKDRDESWPLIEAAPVPATLSRSRISSTSSSWARARTSCPASAPKSKRPRKRAASPRKSCCSASPGSPASISRLFTTSNTTTMAASSPSLPTSRASRPSSPRPSSRT